MRTFRHSLIASICHAWRVHTIGVTSTHIRLVAVSSEFVDSVAAFHQIDSNYKQSNQEMRKRAVPYQVCFVALLLSVSFNMRASAQESLREGFAALAQGSYERAATLLSQFAKDNPDHPSSTEAMLGTGQALEKVGKGKQAVEIFESLLQKNRGTRLENPIRLVYAKSLLGLGLFSKATEHCECVVKEPRSKNAPAAYSVMVTAMCKDSRPEDALLMLREGREKHNLTPGLVKMLTYFIGGHALKQGKATVAKDAYGWQLENDPDDQEEAAIGYAWAEASLASDKASSAKALTDFVDSYPKSTGAPRALLAAARKYLEIQENRKAADILQQIAWNYPEAPETPDALAALSDTADKLNDADLAKKARARLASKHFSMSVGQKVLHQVIADVIQDGDQQDVQQVVASIFSSSATVANLPNTLSIVAQESGQEVANAFARYILQRMADPNHHGSTRQVVQWLFDQKQWNEIAEATVDLPTSLVANNKEQGRLVAESLMRAGKRREAYEIFSVLAQHEDAAFIVTLRQSELAIQFADIEDAELAVTRAENAAGSTKDKQYVAIVAAQLKVRRAEFSSARQRLESVVRSPASDDKLRGRAQWLIGETWFMKQDYAAAIEAYRKCETLFPESGWASAALLQAGKAFEKLGRFPEASICYRNLVANHPDSSHARLATSRLTTIHSTKLR